MFCSHDAAPVDRNALAMGMYNASDICVQFCDDLGLLNDLYLWLLYENSIGYCSLSSRGSKSRGLCVLKNSYLTVAGFTDQRRL